MFQYFANLNSNVSKISMSLFSKNACLRMFFRWMLNSNCVLFSKPIIFTNASKLANVNVLMRSFTIIHLINTQFKWIDFRWIFCHNQCEWMLTWQSFVCSLKNSTTSNQIIYILSHSMNRNFDKCKVNNFIKQNK